jgi:hypothetical protein
MGIRRLRGLLDPVARAHLFQGEGWSRLGEPCSYGGCIEGATCGAGGVCVAPAAVGEPCEWPDSCVDTAYCGPENVCSSRKADGAACDCGECQNACVEGTCRKEPVVSAGLCAGLPSN